MSTLTAEDRMIIDNAWNLMCEEIREIERKEEILPTAVRQFYRQQYANFTDSQIWHSSTKHCTKDSLEACF